MSLQAEAQTDWSVKKRIVAIFTPYRQVRKTYRKESASSNSSSGLGSEVRRGEATSK